MRLARLICWIRPSGHNWRITRCVTSANLWLMHLHFLAGCDATCQRCGEEWRDFDAMNRPPWVYPPSVEENQ